MGWAYLVSIIMSVFIASLFSGSVFAADGNWKDLIGATIEIDDDEIELQATAMEPIPEAELIFDNSVRKKIVAGHAWLDLDDDDGDGKISGIVTSSHDVLGIDTISEDPMETHTHELEARPSPNVLRPWDFCLDFSNFTEIQSEVDFDDNSIEVEVSLEDIEIDPNSLETATSYTIWDPDLNNGPCEDDEVLLKLNGVVRETTVPITDSDEDDGEDDEDEGEDDEDEGEDDEDEDE